MPKPVPFGAALRAARLSVGVSQQDLAARAGLGKQQVWQYEHGTHEPAWSVACRLADALGLGVEAFRTLLPPAPRLCPACGRAFTGHHLKRFCSRRCRPSRRR